MEKRPSVLLPILVSFSLGAALTAQVTRNHDVALKNWPAPLYWQPSQAESEATAGKAEAAIRPPSPDAVGSLVFVAMTPCRVVDTRTSSHVSELGSGSRACRPELPGVSLSSPALSVPFPLPPRPIRST